MTFDFKNPDYSAVRAERAAQLARIREHPQVLAGLREHYAHNPAAFITAWGMTSDPRLIARGLPSEIPLILMPRQVELVDFIMARLAGGESGLVEKSRDAGASVIIASLAATLCLFRPGTVIGIGSRKEDALDRPGDPNSIFHKVRFFLKNLPPEFRLSWDESRHAAHLRIQFPDSAGSAITGESGDQIGRGGRTTAYLIDESAFLERPELVERSLAGTTNCRIDISTPNGRGNAFSQKRWSGKLPVFTLGWRDDLRKDDAWYRRQVETLDPITVGQEIDLNYDASAEGVLLPAPWVQAAIGADRKLGIEVSGERRAALDVADEGRDKNALCGRHGILLEYLSSWSGAGSNIYATTIRALNACAKHRYPTLTYDADGLGAGVRGDAVQINEKRRESALSEIAVEPFRGSGAVIDPDLSTVEGRANRDYFQNAKSQGWWSFRLRFQNTYRAVVEGLPFDPDQIISIDPQLPELHQLVAELSQPTYSLNAAGKIVIDKAPDGAASPNLADAVMIAYAYRAGSYFAAKPARDVSVATAETGRAMPTGMDYVYAVASFVEDVVAVIYVAANRYASDGTRDAALYVLDWDLHQLDADAEGWMLRAAQRLDEFYVTVGAKKFITNKAIYIDDYAQGYAEWLRQRGFQAKSVGKELPPPAERFNLARPYVKTGGLVCLARLAHERAVTLKNVTRNFLRELLSAEQVTPTDPLALAFATAILLLFKDRPAVPPPVRISAADWSPHDWSAGGKPGSAPTTPPAPRVPRDPNLPKPRSYLAAHGTLPPGPHSKRGGIKVG